MKECDIIIIGAGPTGLFTAVNINGKSILILEKKPTAGKKLLMSGSGRCNITQSGSISDFFNHYGDGKRFLIPALKEFTNNNLIEYLRIHGLRTIDIKGKIFPESEDAYDVLDLLLKECKKKKVSINYNENIQKIEVIDKCFSILTDKDSYRCNQLVISTGGKSYPTTGSTGDGYHFAKALGHTIEKAKPALAPVYIKNYTFSELSGISLENRKIAIVRNNQTIRTNQGDIGFTHWGFSGPGILDLSRYIEANDTLKINLINQNPETFREHINQTAINDNKITIKKYLKTFAIPESLIKLILADLNVEPSSHISGISKVQRNEIIRLFCEYPFIVQRTGDFNIAMATKGGVSLKEVSSKTMESKLVKNLYFAGEVLDIDGDTGGYNLQAAFSTGYLVAKNIS
ncbi:MAG: hypothetical protein A2X64_04720 [Ignavibacteria bacterium GWF2_33_9]|nr:MAG: hypothetical protein A2X64_04720 [Ignavibacteria bacterium GWF2_33_9]